MPDSFPAVLSAQLIPAEQLRLPCMETNGEKGKRSAQGADGGAHRSLSEG